MYVVVLTCKNMMTKTKISTRQKLEHTFFNVVVIVVVAVKMEEQECLPK